MRDDFTEKTKVTLAKRVGYKCSNPNCKKTTSGPSEDVNKSTSIGVAAHITGASAGGSRFEEDLRPDDRKSIENGIWLCYNCSVLIDRDDLKYSIDLLKKWKQHAENVAYEEISTANPKKIQQNNNFQTLFFELLNQQEIILEDLEGIRNKTQGNKVLSQEKIIGRRSFKIYFEYFRCPFRKAQNWDSQFPKERISNECLKFFNSAPELVKFFKYNKEFLVFLNTHSSLESIELYTNIFLSKLDYYEKIMLFYYLYKIKDF